MIEQYIESMQGLDVFYITSTILFIVMFISIVIWIFRLDKKYINKMENLPFDK